MTRETHDRIFSILSAICFTVAAVAPVWAIYQKYNHAHFVMRMRELFDPFWQWFATWEIWQAVWAISFCALIIVYLVGVITQPHSWEK